MKPLIGSADHKKNEAAQRKAVRERDYKDGQPCCRFEIWNGRKYVQCGKKSASDTAHIYRRNNCAKAKFHVDVALLACRECHISYDSYDTMVRVPPAYEDRAWKTIVANSKVTPVRHIPQERP